MSVYSDDVMANSGVPLATCWPRWIYERTITPVNGTLISAMREGATRTSPEALKSEENGRLSTVSASMQLSMLDVSDNMMLSPLRVSSLPDALSSLRAHEQRHSKPARANSALFIVRNVI